MLEIRKEALVRTLEEMKQQQGYDYLKKISAVDYGTHIEVLYVLYGTESKKEEVAIVKLDAAHRR